MRLADAPPHRCRSRPCGASPPLPRLCGRNQVVANRREHTALEPSPTPQRLVDRHPLHGPDLFVINDPGLARDDSAREVDQVPAGCRMNAVTEPPHDVDHQANLLANLADDRLLRRLPWLDLP